VVVLTERLRKKIEEKEVISDSQAEEKRDYGPDICSKLSN